MAIPIINMEPLEYGEVFSALAPRQMDAADTQNSPLQVSDANSIQYSLTVLLTP